MSSVVIAGDTSGTVTLQAPAVSGTTTLTLPATSGTVIVGTSGVTAEANGGTGTTTGYYGFKNRIINGAMMISQRGTSFSGTSSIYTLDRWKWQIPTGGGVTQITSTISGFAYSWKYISTGSNSYMQMGQQIEYSNFYDCAGQTVTISFWAKANNTNSGSTALIGRMRYLTSVDGACIFAGINTDTSITISTTATKYTFTYSVPSNAQSLSCEFVLNSNVSGDGFEITGVQLEKGTTATSFDYRPYGTELSLCQRYFWKTNQNNVAQTGCLNGTFRNSTTVDAVTQFPVTMRASPTVTRGGTSDNFYVSGFTATAAYSGFSPSYNNDMMWVELTISGGTTAFNAIYNGQLSFSAEL